MITRLLRNFVLAAGLLTTSFSGVSVEPAFEGDSPSAYRYVQEPKVQESSRSSFRLDFSSPVRRSNERSSLFMLRAFHDALGDNWKSTVQLLSGGNQVALGAIVDADGWIITKASQLPVSGEIVCRIFDGRESVAKIVGTVYDVDLALLHIPDSNLPAVEWESQTVPARGKWLATTDLKSMPAAVGVVSAGVQSIKAADPRLGVVLTETKHGGAITMVLPGSGAEEAGMHVGDTLYSVNGKEFNSRDAVLTAIKNAGRAGEVVRVGLDRAERKFEVDARLMDLTDELLDPTEMEVNGRVSARATGFNRVFLHDTVLDPSQCGGPVVNLDGKAVGLNIARAGRVSSYALPADVVLPVINSLLSQAKLVSRPVEKASSLRPIR